MKTFLLKLFIIFSISFSFFTTTSCNDDETLFDPIEQRKRDDLIIEEFLEDNSLTAQKTASGIYYIVETQGIGTAPIYGDTVLLHFTGMLIGTEVTRNGENNIYGDIFATSIYGEEPVELSVGQVYNTPFNLPIGWDEAIKTTKKGQKVTFFFPSELGYGRAGIRTFIPPYSVLVFDVEILEIKPAF
jgi:FKBP-type peptidyl-prolyl cis-trans isomerase